MNVPHLQLGISDAAILSSLAQLIRTLAVVAQLKTDRRLRCKSLANHSSLSLRPGVALRIPVDT
jgi:hypothetical protein